MSDASRLIVKRIQAVSDGGKPLVTQDVEAMIAIIVISLLALIGAVLTVFAWPRKPSDANNQPVIPPPNFQIGLFDRTAEAY